MEETNLQERRYRSKKTKDEERREELRVSEVISLIRKGRIAHAKELVVKNEENDLSGVVCKKKNCVILGFIHLKEENLAEAEKYLSSALKLRSAYSDKQIEERIFLVSYAGFAAIYCLKYQIETEKGEKDRLRMKAKIFSDLILQNLEIANKNEAKVLLKNIFKAIYSTIEYDGQMLGELKKMDIAVLLEVLLENK